MISIQVPPFMSHHSMPNHYPMSDPAYFNGMPAFDKPLSHNTNYTSSSNSDSKPKACGPGAKRRPSRAGTRSVSTLTAAQLERKRANDREAQRAIRQRTKDHIDALERQIQELTATNDTSARLMQALQRNEELEQENAILRSRLNHAEAAMAVGPNMNHPDMLSGPASPSRRLKLQTQGRASSTPAAPRSVPNSAQLPSHQDAWNGTYSPVSSTVERSPSLADVSPVSTNIRWGPTHPHSPVISDAGHSVDGSQAPQGVNYNYMLDNTGRPMAYSAASEGAMLSTYAASNPSPTANGYSSQLSAPQLSAPQLTSTVPSPAYGQFPGTPQSFISASSHHEEHQNMQQLMQQQQ